ncbi:glycosyltransferase family 2 protein [Thermostichus vulcanus]|uniref:Glycosyltransferase n=1 Tax=Thermostichus vulcanus str. 'Rupite' TaxID=2813851 RepID=A0ABT0C6C3_THEVL|nr:glycosyltransferase [Thermostichus vulcanus]MCJ2541340.1 glycosyltransferase [Thermostichus vulcanus str. 'Rupite']
MNPTPTVSVIVPAYNVQQYITEALQSLICQTWQDFEVLIVNDGSTDSTAEVVETWCQRDPRFHLLSKPNGGLASARNWGIRHAHGELIALLDADDRYLPQKIASHVEILQRHLDVGVVYSASKVIRDDGRPTWLTLSGRPVHSDPLLAMLCKNFIGHGSNAIFRRELFDQIGGFDESLRSCEDLDFWIKVAEQGSHRFYRHPQALCEYRVRPSGLSFNVKKMQECGEQVLQAAFNRSKEKVEPMMPTAYAFFYRLLARLALTAQEPGLAKEYIAKAIASDRSIFWRDPRSLLTLIAVRLQSVSRPLIQFSLDPRSS